MCLCVSLCFSVFAFGVSATSSDGSDWSINLTDYLFVNGVSNAVSFTGNALYTLTLPYSMQISYVDILFGSASNVPPSITWGRNGTVLAELEVLPLGNNVYRAYGSMVGRQGITWELGLTHSSESKQYITFYSINVSKSSFPDFPTTGSIQFAKPSVSVVSMADSSTPARAVLPGSSVSGSIDYSDFYGWIKIPTWDLYDYIDVFLIADTTTIDSLVASVGDSVVPYKISYLNGTVPGFNSTIGSTYVPEFDAMVPDTSHISVVRYIRLTLDVSNINRTDPNDLLLYISGIYDFQNGGYVSLSSVVGHCMLNGTSSIEHWIHKIFISVSEGFDRLANLLSPDSTEVDSSIADANSAISNIHDMENQYAADLDSTLISGEVAKVDNYGNALVFCGSVLSRTFTQLQGYQIIYILPICVGLFLFVASRARPIHVPKQHSAPKANDSQVLDHKEG